MQLDGLDQTTQAAFRGIAAEWTNASERYARDYDAHTAEQGPAPFQIPGGCFLLLVPINFPRADSASGNSYGKGTVYNSPASLTESFLLLLWYHLHLHPPGGEISIRIVPMMIKTDAYSECRAHASSTYCGCSIVHVIIDRNRVSA